MYGVKKGDFTMIPFSVTDSISYTNHKVISFNPEIYDYIKTQIKGSYNILPARLFGLSYAEYLRFVREKIWSNSSW